MSHQHSENAGTRTVQPGVNSGAEVGGGGGKKRNEWEREQNAFLSVYALL